ncbi:cGAS-like receptor 2 [Cochliomyia hominivorax]
MELLPNLETVLNNCNLFINIDQDREKYSNHCENLKHCIFKKLRENRVFNYFFNGFLLSGSCGDNLKVSKPNEFDIIFYIKFPEQTKIDVENDPYLPGNVFLNFTKVIKKIEKERQHKEYLRFLKRWLDDKNYLKVDSLQSFIQSNFTKVLNAMEYRIIFNGKTATLRYSRQGPAHTIYVRESFELIYSIDFVPGILLNEEQQVINVRGDWEAIPKPTKLEIKNFKSFRASYFRQEQYIIRYKYQLKNALRMMKKFRDAKTNMNKMKSYFIKTLFLHKASTEPATYWTRPLQKIIIDMFKTMEESLRNKMLPFFWNKKLNLFEEFNPGLVSEMLICVEKSRKTLEKADCKLTLTLQDLVYRIFLNKNEMINLRKLNAATNGNISNLKEQYICQDQSDDNSICTVL